MAKTHRMTNDLPSFVPPDPPRPTRPTPKPRPALPDPDRPPAMVGEILPPEPEEERPAPASSKRVVIHEDRGPMVETRAFLARYAALAAVLLILSAGVTEIAAWPRVAALAIFGALAVVGFLAMWAWDTRHTVASLQARAIDAEERIRMEQIRQEAAHRRRVAELEHAARVAATRQISAQVEEASRPQSHANALANYRPDDPPVDELRAELLAFLAGLYDPNRPGRLTSNGRIMDCTVPWSARGSLDAEDKRRAVAMLAEAAKIAGVPIVEQRRGAWYVNVRRFPTAGRLVQAMEAAHTPRRRD